VTTQRSFCAITAFLAIAAVPGYSTTFAQFTETSPQQTLFTLTNNAGTSVTVSVSNGAIDYKFAVPNALGTAFRSGILNFTGTSTTPATGPDISGNLNEGGFTGSGSIFDILTGTIALSWTYGPSGALQVPAGGTGGTMQDSRPPSTEVNFTSPYLNFGATVSQSYSFGLSGATTPWSLGPGSFPNNDSASIVGTFDAQPVPVGTPEPASMLVTSGALLMLGLMGRRRFAR